MQQNKIIFLEFCLLCFSEFCFQENCNEIMYLRLWRKLSESDKRPSKNMNVVFFSSFFLKREPFYFMWIITAA